MKFVFSLLLTILLSVNLNAQSARLSEQNTIAWLAYTGTIKLAKKWSLHTEYQWRRVNTIEHWQQSLPRVGINYAFTPAATAQAGYAYILTYSYGEYSLNVLGKTFPEHRTYEQISLVQKAGSLDLTHRYRLEQRWIGKYNTAASESPESFTYLNRFRYMLRATLPLKGTTLDDDEPYIAAFDEVFIGFGRNVGENIFDQNRVALLAGYRFSKGFRLEGGYLNQTVQLGREIGGKNVFQYNNGVLLSGVLSL